MPALHAHPSSAIRRHAGLFLILIAFASACSSDQSVSQRDGAGTAGTGKANPQPTRTSGRLAVETLTTNDAAIEIIKESEQLRLEAYTLGGRQYIGYGHQMKPGDRTRITEAEAERLLREDLRDAEASVRRAITVPITRNQFSAMVSLAYNIGTGNFARSSLPPAVNAEKFDEAADVFLLYVKANGKVLSHLEERRKKERALFLAR